MDDGFESQYTRGYPILKQYGMKGCIAVIPTAVGSPNYMDYDQLAELYMAGWDMLNHTYNHETLAALSAERQKKQISEGSAWLKSHALSRGSDILVYPGGYNNASTLETLKNTGVKAARSLKSVWSSDLSCNIENVEVCNVISWTPHELVKAAVDKAADNCGTVVFVFHKIEPITDDTQMQVEERRFREMVEYIASLKDSINVITFSELLY